MSSELTIDKTTFVTFYSFKGGVGRSMALVNVAGIMAGRGFRVLALDMDLEAPGISYLLRQGPVAEPEEVPGFVDLLGDACERGEEADLFALSPPEVVERYSYLYPLPEEIRQKEDGFLRIMPAGRLDLDYQRRLDALALGQLYREGRGQPLVAAFKQVIASAEMFDFVFIDSRTGFSDESGICTRDLADYLVVIMGLNRQNEAGTVEFLRSLRGSPAVPKGLRVVLSPVPNGEDDLVERREKEASAALSAAYGQEIKLNLQIPYHPRLALTEEPHIFRRSRGYLYEAYASIERAVLTMLGLTAVALRKEVLRMAESKRVDAILHLLRRLERVPGGSQALAGLVAHELDHVLFIEQAQELRQYLSQTFPSDSWVLDRLAVELHERKYPDAELFYQRLLEADSVDANTLGNYANFLTDVRGDHDQAEAMYKRALEEDPRDANNLGNYAIFLMNVRGDHDQAETMYKRALDLAPKNANTLGNYANFLTDVRGDHDQAEAMYKRALEEDPKNANTLGNYAVFLMNVRGDHDQAEAMYKRALDEDPKNATKLGNYALFLKNVRGDHDQAEAMYKRALAEDPKNANSLGNYALFLTDVRGDHDQAEAMFKRALAEDPKNATNLGNYANFLTDVRGDHDQAEAMFKRDLELAPQDANKLGNYAKMLFIVGRGEEARQELRKAFDMKPSEPPLLCELWFYAYAHAQDAYPEALSQLKQLLLAGKNSKGWKLTENVGAAVANGHPEPAFLAALAEVVSGKNSPDMLDRFDAWKAA